MIPKNHKIFIKPTAEELNIHESIVSDAVGFYYSELRKMLGNIEANAINVTELGTFKVKTKELLHLKAKTHAHLAVLKNPETFNQMKTKKELEDKLEKVSKALDVIIEEDKRKKEIKKKRYESSKRNLEE